jgi:hypothetical protein
MENTNTNLNPNIHVENLCENHLFFRKKDKENCIKVNYKKEKKSKKICVYDDSCKYYIKITQQIHQIPNYKTYFYTYEKAEFLDLTKIEDSTFKKIALSNSSGNQYLLFTYKYLSKYTLTFSQKIHQSLHQGLCKPFLMLLLNSYKQLLKNVQQLLQSEKKLCFFQISSTNILFSQEEQGGVSFLKNFHACFSCKNSFFKVEHLLRIFSENTIDNFSYQPLEVHLIYFLWKNNINTLSFSHLEEISRNYIKSMSIFSLLNELERDTYIQTCIHSLKIYINKDLNTIVEKMVSEYSFSWDNFALSVLFFYIVENICRTWYFPSETFLQGWSKLLLKNIHGNPFKRETVDSTIEILEQLLEKNPSWLFVNTISSDKMQDLLRVL